MSTTNAQTRAALERRSSGAAGSHADRRTKRNRDRSAQVRNAVNEAKSDD